MYPSMLRTSGDWFADFEQLQDRLDELLGGRSATSSIRAVGRAGAFPALNVGTSPEALEIYAFAPGIDPEVDRRLGREGVLAISGERRRRTARRDAARPRRAQRLRQRALHRPLPPRRRACPKTPTRRGSRRPIATAC